MTQNTLDAEHLDHVPRDNKKFYIFGALFGVLLVVGASLASVYLYEGKIAPGSSDPSFSYEEKIKANPDYRPGDI